MIDAVSPVLCRLQRGFRVMTLVQHRARERHQVDINSLGWNCSEFGEKKQNLVPFTMFLSSKFQSWR